MTEQARPLVLAVPVELPLDPTADAPPSGRRWTRQRGLVVGLGLIGLIVFLAVAAPLVAGYSPTAQDLNHPLAGSSLAHPLGTDELGRDTWSRLVYGARPDLEVGFLGVLAPLIIGTGLGLISGYYGRWLDRILGRLVEIVIAFPFFVLVIALVFVLGSGTGSVLLALTLVDWVVYMRIVRAEVLVAKHQEWVQAAKSGGLSDRRILLRHILPNVITPAVVYSTSDVVFAILTMVTAGFLGLGISAPGAEWGAMIADGQTYLTTQWQLATIPGLAIVAVGLAMALIGDGLADLWRPD